MDADVPLVILKSTVSFNQTSETKDFSGRHCATIQLAMVLAPIHVKYGIDRVVVSTYQSHRELGEERVEELSNR